MQRRTLSSIACAVCLACPLVSPTAAWALGFGRSTSVASLGQTLDFRVPITLEAGETLLPECFTIEVMHGESKLDPPTVRYSLDPEPAAGPRMLRVRTLVPIEELVVQLQVGVGCPPRFSRRFTLFPDPPIVTVAANDAAVRSAAAAAASGGSDEPPTVIVTAPRPPPAVAAPKPAAKAFRPQPRRVPSLVAVAPEAMKAAPAAPTALKPPPADTAPASMVRKPAASEPGARLVLDPITPRLKLDMEEPVFMGAAAIAAMASASAAEDAEQADLERLRVLERSLNQLKQESQAQRADSGKLKAELKSAQADQRWLPWLMGLLALSVLLIVWLAWRLRRQSASAQWWDEAGAAADADAQRGVASAPGALAPEEPIDDEPDDAMPDRVQATMPPDEVSWSDIDEAAPGFRRKPQAFAEPPSRVVAGIPAMAAAAAAAASAKADSAFDWKTSTSVRLGEPVAQREVAVEELLDLEQQADFFIALGQEDAAIELLTSHLRSTKGRSPLPYTQLLESYRRRGDRESYEKIRARFNRQFNANAPDWDDGPGKGRTLEAYTEIVGRLQGLWARPAEAMKALESMLIRRDDDAELFDLPAYRDVLMLYALARDLQQQRDDAPRDVDVLLPLSTDAAMSSFLDGDTLDFDLTGPAVAPPSSNTQAGSFGVTDSDPTFDIKLR